MEWESWNAASEVDTDEEDRAITGTQKGRRNIRHIKDVKDLRAETIAANRNEKERISRLESIERRMNEALSESEKHEDLILDYDFENKLPLVSVHKTLVQKMKPHQVKANKKEGVKFMWNACYESLKQIKTSQGSGCILAHCMGLGKTFQVVTLVHTLLTHEEVGTKHILICCPKNTLLNWMNEFTIWITQDLAQINVFNPARFDKYFDRLEEIEKWERIGGVCLINYQLLRILLQGKKNNQNLIKFSENLWNYDSHQRVWHSLTGADLVICDEGHVLKNEEAKLSKVMSEIRTKRRIVLSGTPMQNNLKEYHCMIEFVKGNLLGSRQEFVNMFVNPILNGQYENSSAEDVQLMKERSHILHKKLSGCVQRFDLSTLKCFLPEKREYVISIALTECQMKMYKFYLSNYSAKGDPKARSNGVALFADYQSLQRIWTHPLALKFYADKYEEEKNKKKGKGKKGKGKRKKKKVDVYSSEEEESTDCDTFLWTRFPPLWWLRFIRSEDLEDARQSNKLLVLLHIIKRCEESNEKLLVFSGSLYSLRLIEHFLRRIHHSEGADPSLCHMTSTWEEGSDYLVLTGQTSGEDRDRFCRSFNDPNDPRLRLFLISTKAGGMGINLTAASRAVIFDVSWNPSHDVQSVFRIYRLGQKKRCFVYRFVAAGTMEEKMYGRQVTKESVSHRVVDEKQIARHYTQGELEELYRLEPCGGGRGVGRGRGRGEVEDPLVRGALSGAPAAAVWGIHEHDSLLEHREEEELEELEKNDAWLAYKKDEDEIDKIENLPPNERRLLSELKPESFDPFYFRIVLKGKYPEATEEEISLAMTELMPKIKSILERDDFIDVMKREAVSHHSRRLNSSKKGKIGNVGKMGKMDGSDKRKNDKQNCNKTIDLTRTPPSPVALDSGNRSESEDSVFMYKISRKRRKVKGNRKPLKVWGVLGGKAFGSPERDLSD